MPALRRICNPFRYKLLPQSLPRQRLIVFAIISFVIVRTYLGYPDFNLPPYKLLASSHNITKSIEEVGFLRGGDKINAAVNQFTECFMQNTDSSESLVFWSLFHYDYSNCYNKTELTRVKVDNIEKNGKIASFIFGKNHKRTVASFGLHGDVSIETRLSQMLSWNSEFFGTDAITKPNAELFEPLGTFFTAAISRFAGNSKFWGSSGLENKDEVNQVSMDTMLSQYINKTVIDYMLMDLDGEEYGILPMMQDSGMLDKATVCQLNVEFTKPNLHNKKIVGHVSFSGIIQKLIREHRFIPITDIEQFNRQTFLFNFGSPYCVKEYISQFF